MKNMRKGLVAAATALTVSLAGVSVANAQGSSVNDLSAAVGSSETTTSAPATVTPESTDAPATTEQNSGSSEDLDAKEIREWIAVFTAVIGAMSTLIAFLDKI